MIKEEDEINFEDSIAPWIGRTVKMGEYRLQELFKEASLDITKEQMIVLKKLHDKNGMSQNELASMTYRDKSSLARLLSKMEKKKYVLRAPSKIDKRINEVFLTNEGKEIFKRGKPIMKSMIQTMEQNISDSEKQQIIKTLKKVQQNFISSIESL